jgi:hypothetical protein
LPADDVAVALKLVLSMEGIPCQSQWPRAESFRARVPALHQFLQMVILIASVATFTSKQQSLAAC